MAKIFSPIISNMVTTVSHSYMSMYVYVGIVLIGSFHKEKHPIKYACLLVQDATVIVIVSAILYETAT